MPEFHIDMLTILFTLAAVNLVAALLVGVQTLVAKTSVPYGYFLLAKTFQGAAWILRIVSFTGAPRGAGHAADLILLTGFALEAALLVRFTQKLTLRHFIILGGTWGILATASVVVGTENELLRDLVVFLGFLGFLTYAAIRLYFAQGARRFQRFLASVYAGIPLVLAVLFGMTGAEVTRPGFSQTPGALAYFTLLLFLQLVGTVGYLLMVQERDVENLQDLATHDSLTGALNHRAYYQRADALVSNACRKGEPISVIVADLDHFKQINDRHSYQIGDLALVHFSQAVVKSTRQGDLFARNRGDRFVIYLPDTAEETAIVVAERIQTTLATLPRLPGLPEFTASLGIGTGILKKAGDMPALMTTAEQALFMAKNNGRNRVEGLTWVAEDLPAQAYK